MPHMPITSYAGIRQLCPYIYVIWTPCNQQCDHISGICPWTNMPTTLHMSNFTSTVVYEKTQHSYINPFKNQLNATHIYHITARYVPGANKLLKCHICHMHKLLGVSMGEVSKYICHTRIHWHQPCNEECLTQTTMTTWPITLTELAIGKISKRY